VVLLPLLLLLELLLLLLILLVTLLVTLLLLMGFSWPAAAARLKRVHRSAPRPGAARVPAGAVGRSARLRQYRMPLSVT
jgi:hypothetical protein